ncbi:hypothetical protein E1301_Tti009791 [Triplophysa tibetana]|uniref:Uncharacterized protein n=1 Tax=Triplophysa tibetana TaxID=1572043 RepID=A0A5A9N5R1_9TELE|nr:hypothetical protein E1301_Tti009791 [Triplophysa tibetana]
MMLNSALMSHNAGAISHQNPCRFEAEERELDKSRGKGVFVIGEKGGKRREPAMPARAMFCTVEVCVGGRWVVVQMENLGEQCTLGAGVTSALSCQQRAKLSQDFLSCPEVQVAVPVTLDANVHFAPLRAPGRRQRSARSVTLSAAVVTVTTGTLPIYTSSTLKACKVPSIQAARAVGVRRNGVIIPSRDFKDPTLSYSPHPPRVSTPYPKTPHRRPLTLMQYVIPRAAGTLEQC